MGRKRVHVKRSYIPMEFVLSVELSLDAVKCDENLLLAQYVRFI